MESVLKRAILRGEQQQECDVLQAIREVCSQLDSVQARFEMESDSRRGSPPAPTHRCGITKPKRPRVP